MWWTIVCYWHTVKIDCFIICSNGYVMIFYFHASWPSSKSQLTHKLSSPSLITDVKAWTLKLKQLRDELVQQVEPCNKNSSANWIPCMKSLFPQRCDAKITETCRKNHNIMCLLFDIQSTGPTKMDLIWLLLMLCILKAICKHINNW